MEWESSREVKISADKHHEEAEWVKIQIRDALSSLRQWIVADKAKTFYEKKDNEIVYNMDTVRGYLSTLKEKKSWKELTSRNSSAMIMAIQISLYSLGYEFWNIDWLLWDKTKQAIQKFQKDHQLPVDTYWRALPSTIEKLLEAISKKEEVAVSQQDEKEYVVVEQWTGVEKRTTEEHIEEWTVWTNIKYPLTDGAFYTPDENMEWITAQETIRPEIQELINSYNWNAEHFKNVTELTKAEVKAICEIHWIGSQYLYLSSLEKIHPAALEELSKHHSWVELWLKTLTKEQAQKMVGFKYGIWFNNLISLEPSVIQPLSKTEWRLEFSAINQLTPEIMAAFSEKQFWDLVFNAVDSLDIQTAEKMVNYPGKIFLNNVKEISGDIAKVLSKNPWSIFLKNLDGKKPLSNDVLEWLSAMNYLQFNSDVADQVEAYKKEKKIDGKELSTPILELYNSGFRDLDSLKNLTSLTYDDAVLLSWITRPLDLSWIKSFEQKTFEALMKANTTITLWLEEFPEELAKSVEWRTYWLDFINLKHLDEKSAQYLAHYYWALGLNELETITPWVAKILSWKWWNAFISLNWIQEENPQVFEEFKNYSGGVSFKNITSLSLDSAMILEKKSNWIIYLNGLTFPIPDEIIPYLAHNITHISTNADVSGQLDRYLHPEKYEQS